MFHNRMWVPALGIVLLMSIQSNVDAGCHGRGCQAGCNDCCATCPKCSTSCKRCCLKVDEGEESKHCWQVECKEICVPRIVLPWQKSCCNPAANNGAWVKKVNVLVKHSYTCPTCEYSWTPVDACGGDGGAAGCNGCANGCAGCAAGPADSEAWQPQPPPASPAPMEADAVDEGAAVPEVPEAPRASTSALPLLSAPGPFHSTSTQKTSQSSDSVSVLPIRFIRAAKAKLSR